MTASYKTSSERIRHSRRNPCRLCGGGGDFPPHHPQRCRGYEQGDYVYCQRITAPRDGPIETYRHWLGGPCDCGQNHSGVTRPAYVPPAYHPSAGPRRDTTEKPLGVEREIDRYDYPIEGLGVYQKIRYETWHEGVRTNRRFEWRSPRGEKRLPQGGIGNLRMYGMEDFAGFPRDGSVAMVVVEGEKAAKALRRRGIAATSWGGGGNTVPGVLALEDLRGLPVIQWPDNDSVGLAQADKYLPGLRAVASSIWRLDVSAFGEHEDAYDFAGTDEELRSFLATAKRVEEPLVEDDGPAAAAAAGEIFDADRRRRKALRDRYSTGMLMTEIEDLVRRGVAINECMERWLPAICGNCGAKPAFLTTCHDANCPLCAPGRMKHDWQIMIDRLPELKAERFAMVRWIPDAPVTGPKALKDARNRFTEGRKRLRLEAGIVGNRTSRQHGAVVLTAFPSSVAVPARCGSFTAEVVRENASERDVATWLWQEYEDEIAEACEASEAGDAAFYLAWLAATKGRKRFSAFGKLWCTPIWSPIEDDRTVNGGTEDAVPVSIAGFTGGSGHAGEHEKRKCPFCGSTRLTKYAFKVASDRLTNERGHTEWVPLDR